MSTIKRVFNKVIDDLIVTLSLVVMAIFVFAGVLVLLTGTVVGGLLFVVSLGFAVYITIRVQTELEIANESK